MIKLMTAVFALTLCFLLNTCDHQSSILTLTHFFHRYFISDNILLFNVRVENHGQADSQEANVYILASIPNENQVQVLQQLSVPPLISQQIWNSGSYYLSIQQIAKDVQFYIGASLDNHVLSIENSSFLLNYIWSAETYQYTPYFCDLTILNFSCPARGQVGDSLPTSLEIGNMGNAFAEDFSIFFFLSTDSVYDDSDVLLQTIRHDGLDFDTAKNWNSLLENVLLLPSFLDKGRYYCIVVLNLSHEIEELNYWNNQDAKPIFLF